MKNENLAFKRIGAYAIDYILILIISMVFVYLPINPKLDEYIKVSDSYTTVLDDYSKGSITSAEFNTKTMDLSYDMNKNGMVYIGCSIIVAFLYYGVFAYVTDGQTLGKKLMKIKIVSKEEKSAKIYQYFIRTFLINGVIMNIVTLIAVNFNKGTYNSIYSTSSNLNLAFLLIVFLTIVFSNENRGLHDRIAGTKVISTKNPEVEIIKKEDDSNE